MIKSSRFILLFMLVIAVLISACNQTGSDQSGQTSSSSLERPTPPSNYVNKKSPRMNEAAIEAGKQAYQINCSSCHGEKGMGDGPVSASLNPKPEPLAVNADQLSDGYLFWRISEGGAGQSFTSAMPAWKSILKEEQIWQVIAYLRGL